VRGGALVPERLGDAERGEELGPGEGALAAREEDLAEEDARARLGARRGGGAGLLGDLDEDLERRVRVAGSGSFERGADTGVPVRSAGVAGRRGSGLHALDQLPEVLGGILLAMLLGDGKRAARSGEGLGALAEEEEGVGEHPAGGGFERRNAGLAGTLGSLGEQIRGATGLARFEGGLARLDLLNEGRRMTGSLRIYSDAGGDLLKDGGGFSSSGVVCSECFRESVERLSGRIAGLLLTHYRLDLGKCIKG
jgi:hypothetical protein